MAVLMCIRPACSWRAVLAITTAGNGHACNQQAKSHGNDKTYHPEFG